MSLDGYRKVSVYDEHSRRRMPYRSALLSAAGRRRSQNFQCTAGLEWCCSTCRSNRPLATARI